MRRGARRARHAGVVLATVLALGLALRTSASDTASGFRPETWLQGADGLVEALRRSDEGDPRAVVVYFYTDWCGYCRQFERELLGTPPVAELLSGLLAVRLNPEAGALERSIADYYSVNGYPAFFVQRRGSRAMTRLDRTVAEEGGGPRLMRPSEFVGAVTEAIDR